MRINEVICVTHELDLLETHLIEHQPWVDKFFIKVCEVSWNRLPTPKIDWSRFSRFNIEVIDLPIDIYTPIPASYPAEERDKWFRQMQTNRMDSKQYKWDRISEDCDYILHTDVDEIIRDSSVVLSDLEGLDFYAVRLADHNQWANYVVGTQDLYRFTKAGLPYEEYYKGRPRKVSDTVVGWHFTNCFKDPVDFQRKLDYAASLPRFAGKSPSLEEIQSILDSGEVVHWAKRKYKSSTDGETLLGSDWAPKFIKDNPERFLWKS